MRGLMILIASSAIFPLLGGCLVMSTNEVDESGTRISESTLANIDHGKTTGEWLLATLGEPTARTPVADRPDVEVWRYDHARTEQSAGAVFLIFGGSSSTTQRSRAFFELENGVVMRSWQEA